jgi:putative molybdopterin biosynthesis protein
MTGPQTQFLTVLDRDEAERRFRAVLVLSPLGVEEVALAEALGRVLGEDVIAPTDVPAFDRSNVDGYAVRAEDTFGAEEESPRELRLTGESLEPGRMPGHSVEPGTATLLATGAMLPRGADAVVMVEYADEAGERVRLTRPVAPGANVTFAGTDIGRGELVLRRGHMLTSRETGVLAALGLDRVPVVRRPRVAIVSTGNELVAPGTPLRPGQVHDSNGRILADAVRELGGEPVSHGIVPDDEVALEAVLRRALECDVVLLSGGTSKGEGDISYRVVGRLGRPGIVAHGVALKPGKPLCLAAIQPDDPERRVVPVAVLPGFPTSAIFTFREFLAPVIRALAGRADEADLQVMARLPQRVNSERGRTEYLLVGLVPGEAGLSAYPMGKGSGSVTTFSMADGFVVIPRQREYLEAGETVPVHLLSRGLRVADLVVIGSQCVGLDFLLGQMEERGVRCKFLAVGSTAGLDAARRGECDLAGVHLLDPVSGVYNVPFLGESLTLIRGYGRRQGIVYRRSDGRFEGHTASEALAAALADPACVLVNRNRGSGTRVLLDRLLGSARPAGYLTEARSHNAVAAAVRQGRADWGLAIDAVLRGTNLQGEAELGFLPVQDEHYDFAVPRARRERPAVESFARLLSERTIQAELESLGFHLAAK